MLTTAEIAPKRAFPILRSTYHQLGEAGVFQGRRVQLVYGTIIDMSPMGIPHRTALRVLNRTFVELVPRTWDVMVQVPLDLADDSEPEPDFSFVPRFTPGEVEPHAAVVMELADSSLKLDLGPKARLYAEAKIPEYWVLDLSAHQTVVHHSPRAGRYTKVRRVPWIRVCESKQIPELSVRFADVLPL